jgi:hypothetical protein
MSTICTAVAADAAEQTTAHSTPRRSGKIVLERSLNGPRRSANGGFAAGYIATQVPSETVTVVLRRPIRLGVELVVEPDTGNGVLILDRRTVVAQARPGKLTDGTAPRPPSEEDALRARAAHPLRGVRHLLADCVVCRTERRGGMHVTPGPVPGRTGILAAPWVVTARFSHAGAAEYAAVWAALDCTSYPAQALAEAELCLLGTMTARVDRRPRVGEHLVVYSWTREHRGRRYETSVVMVDEDGVAVAVADSTWIAVRRPRLAALAQWLL